MDAGDILGRKYRLIRLLGRGSMGAVWTACHTTLGEEVAVKLLTRAPELDGMEDDAAAAARFRFEAQVAARLSRKTRHIVRVTDHGEEDGVAYLVMELLEGKTLASRLLLRGRLPPRDVAQIVAQSARALEVAHAEGVVHRDLKPANVFLTRDEDGWVLLKLLDFGIARAIHTRRVAPAFATAAGFAAGTPGYMSPEQARGGHPNPQFDLWALSTIAYEALTGELPMAGVSAQELFENACAGRVDLNRQEQALVGGLDAFFERAFHPRPDSRYATAPELAAAFARAVDGVEAEQGTDATPNTADPTATTVRAGAGAKPASKGATLRMASPGNVVPPLAAPSRGTQPTATVAMPSRATTGARARGVGALLAAALLFGGTSAIVGHLWTASPPRGASVSPASSSSLAVANDRDAVATPPDVVVTAAPAFPGPVSPIATPPSDTTLLGSSRGIPREREVRAVTGEVTGTREIPTAPLGARSKTPAPEVATAAPAVSPPKPLTTKTVDRSATF
jgi:serine/threonine-protein kinase